MAGNGTRVVLVEDYADTAAVLAQLLRMEGYLVQTACDGSSALELIDRFKPRIVLLDVGLPDTSGAGLALWLRERYGDQIVLIAITGLPRDGFGVEDALGIVDHHLHKPVEPDALLALLAATRARDP